MSDFCDKCGAESIDKSERRLERLLTVTQNIREMVVVIAPRLQHQQAWQLKIWVARIEKLAATAFDAHVARRGVIGGATRSLKDEAKSAAARLRKVREGRLAVEYPAERQVSDAIDLAISRLITVASEVA